LGRITVISSHLSATDLNYTILIELSKARKKGHDVCWMYENDCAPFTDIAIPRMSVGKMWEDQSNTGIIIATSLESAALIKDLPNKKNKAFYIWFLEFMWTKWNYLDNIAAMSNIDLYTRSESYRDLINNYSNICPKVVPDFNLEEICQNYQNI
jgi:hypothetical protein